MLIRRRNGRRRRAAGAVAAAMALAMSLWAAGPAAAQKPAPPATDILDAETAGRLLEYLRDLNRWIMTLDVGSGSLKNAPPKETTDSIFINGNFARVLLASAGIAGEASWRAEALRWCDTFYRQQQLAISSRIEEAGFWPDMGTKGNIYFGDMGTAVTALAMGHRAADPKRQALYLRAMERMARFVLDGTLTDPQGQGREACRGWVIAEGPDAGALGCGYYQGHLSTLRYTVATSNTGGTFLPELYAITGREEYRKTATGAVQWLLRIRKPSGEIPYILDGKDLPDWPLDTMSYCTEAFVAAEKYLKDAALRERLGQELKPSVRWLLSGQNPDGTWGRLRSSDQQRSPRCLTLLTWYYRTFERDAAIAEAVRRYVGYLLDPANSKAYGVKELVKTSGFIGLAVAELLAPGSTF